MTTYENLRVARRGPIVSIAAYLLLTIAKLIAGHFLNSSSLIADGFNSLGDVFASTVTLWGMLPYSLDYSWLVSQLIQIIGLDIGRLKIYQV